MKDFLELVGLLFVAFLMVLMVGAVPAIACGGCAYLTAAGARLGWGE
ncbi:hypothetical protein WMF38_57705 [Sorangium sp. So ce118]